MTRARNGVASVAPGRAVTWYPLPFDEGIPKYAPRCADGDEILVRKADGTVVTCTVERHHGEYYIGPDGEAVEAEAIARPMRLNISQLAPLVIRAYNETRGPGDQRWHELPSGSRMRLMGEALRHAKRWFPS